PELALADVALARLLQERLVRIRRAAPQRRRRRVGRLGHRRAARAPDPRPVEQRLGLPAVGDPLPPAAGPRALALRGPLPPRHPPRGLEQTYARPAVDRRERGAIGGDRLEHLEAGLELRGREGGLPVASVHRRGACLRGPGLSNRKRSGY